MVIEAKYRSGTSVTAKLAKKQERKLFVLPHEIWDVNGKGTNKLLKEGATIITSTEDIINNLENLEYKNKKEIKINGKIEIIEEKNSNKNEDTENKKEIKSSPKIEGEYNKIDNKEYKEIYKIIENKICGINEIVRKTGRTIREINQDLLMMEIEGYIKKVEGGYKGI